MTPTERSRHRQRLKALKTPHAITTVVAYVRYSSIHQGVASLARQCDRIEAWAVRTACTITAVYFDLETSRTTDHGERPGLTAALDSLVKGGVIVAENVSRFAGDGYILESIRREARKHEGRAATADESGDAELDEDRQDVEAWVSKRTVKAIQKNTKGALAMKKLRGERTGSVTYGYQLRADGMHSDRCRQTTTCTGCRYLEPNPDEQRVISRARDLRDAGVSLWHVVKRLNSEGFTNRRGGTFTRSSVLNFLSQSPQSNGGIKHE